MLLREVVEKTKIINVVTNRDGALHLVALQLSVTRLSYACASRFGSLIFRERTAQYSISSISILDVQFSVLGATLFGMRGVAQKECGILVILFLLVRGRFCSLFLQY